MMRFVCFARDDSDDDDNGNESFLSKQDPLIEEVNCSLMIF